MKRYIAALAGALIICCAFSSCGGSKRSSETDSSPAVTTTKAKTTQTTESAADETQTESEAETAAKTETTTAETTQPKTTEPKITEPTMPSIPKKPVNINDAYGHWLPETSKQNGSIYIENKNTAWIGVDHDMTDTIRIDSQNNVYLADKKLTSDMYSFDGKTLKIDYDGNNMLTMVKTDGSNSLLGAYEWKGGVLYDAAIEAFNKNANLSGKIDSSSSKLIMECSSGKSNIRAYFKISGFKLTEETVNFGSFFGSSDSGNHEYVIDGDMFIVYSPSGGKVTMKRIG